MNNIKINAVALACALAFSVGASAQGMTKADYKAGKAKIEADYKAARANCVPLAGNAKDICMVDAKGKEKVAKAEIDASYTPRGQDAPRGGDRQGRGRLRAGQGTMRRQVRRRKIDLRQGCQGR